MQLPGRDKLSKSANGSVARIGCIFALLSEKHVGREGKVHKTGVRGIVVVFESTRRFQGGVRVAQAQGEKSSELRRQLQRFVKIQLAGKHGKKTEEKILLFFSSIT